MYNIESIVQLRTRGGGGGFNGLGLTDWDLDFGFAILNIPYLSIYLRSDLILSLLELNIVDAT